MAERCPLEDNMVWDNETGRSAIPDVCQIQCEGIWDVVTQKKADSIDVFDSSCDHLVEYGGTSLHRAGGALRSVGILQLCMSEEHDEAFAESWSFTCPFDEIN